MSINDILNDDSFLPMCYVLFFIIMIIAIPAGMAMNKKLNKEIYGDGASGEFIEEKKVKIVSRRTTPHPANQAVMINMVVFEQPNGMRIELAIKDAGAYGVMVEGDRGILKYQGKRFISFTRSNENEV